MLRKSHETQAEQYPHDHPISVLQRAIAFDIGAIPPKTKPMTAHEATNRAIEKIAELGLLDLAMVDNFSREQSRSLFRGSFKAEDK